MDKKDLIKIAPRLILGVALLIVGIFLFLNYFGTGARAAGQKALALIAGESADISCVGENLAVSRTNRKTIRVDCKGRLTPTPAAVSPTVVTNNNPPTSGVMPSGMVMPTTDSNRPADWSYAMGRWGANINPNFIPDGPQQYPMCSQAFHDSFYVVGPDGKKYPTWHPIIGTDPATGQTCSFGHEHGKDPKKYEFYGNLQKHFAYDANKNGAIESGELATAGIPFGYVNEQIDVAGLGYMRHEDHVGHKIEYANGEWDTQTEDRFDNSISGGLIIPEKTNGGGEKWRKSGLKCYFFDKIHQGVHSADALTMNLHEAILHAKCTSTRSDYKSNETLLTGMIKFGNAGEFYRFATESEIAAASRTNDPMERLDPRLRVVLGKDATNANYPDGYDPAILSYMNPDNAREIHNRKAVEEEMLVPSGKFSSFPYELWTGALKIKNSSGKVLAELGGGWEVLDAIRYHYPAMASKIGYSSDICYEVLGDRKARGGTCDIMTNYGNIKGITWKDTRSGFKGLHRGQYVGAPMLDNAGGPSNGIYYTDVYGEKASTTPFTGSIKQLVPPIATRIEFSSDPRNTIRHHGEDSSRPGVSPVPLPGANSVHAPN